MSSLYDGADEFSRPARNMHERPNLRIRLHGRLHHHLQLYSAALVAVDESDLKAASRATSCPLLLLPTVPVLPS